MRTRENNRVPSSMTAHTADPNGAVLSTAGNLVFQGQGTGEFAAYAAKTPMRFTPM
jgi:hypothetical protein